MQRFSWVLVMFALIVAGCGGGGGGMSATAPGLQAAGTAPGTMTLTIPAGSTSTSANGRKPEFISAALASVKISMSGLADQIFNLTANSSGCTNAPAGRTCTITFNATAGQPSITVTLYDGTNASANVLGTATGSTTVTAGQPFTFNLTINGAISTVTINLSSGFSIGFPGTATVSVTAHDADGNLIAGPGNFAVPVILQNTDTSGSFTLSGTTIAGPTSTVTLTYNGGSPSVSNPMLNASVAQSGVVVTSALMFNGGTLSCGSPLPLPASYTSIFAVGSVAATTFTANTTGATPPSTWVKIPYTQGTPTPAPTPATPGPSPTPTATPTPGQPVYIYVGTYTTTSGTSGCFFAITSQDGSPLTEFAGGSFAGNSGLADGTPNLPANATANFLGITSGNVSSLVLSNLSATGGNGTASLSNGDSGTITLTTRFATTTDKARRLIEQQRRR